MVEREVEAEEGREGSPEPEEEEEEEVTPTPVPAAQRAARSEGVMLGSPVVLRFQTATLAKAIPTARIAIRSSEVRKIRPIATPLPLPFGECLQSQQRFSADLRPA